jgi:hypothetical protein
MTSMYEPVANTGLARLLDGMTGPATVEPEPPDALPGGKRPDLLITAPGRSPVVIEARQMPAANLEEDAAARFALGAVIGGRELEAVIALRYPAGMTELTADTPLEYAALSRRPGGGLDRFPASGWLNGKAADLADLIRLVSVPQSAVDAAANFLQEGIDHGAEILDEEVDRLRPGIAREIAGLLGMDNVAQTRRMACAIIANAMVFHERIAGMRDNIRPLRFVCGPGVANPQEQTLNAWADILKINYWPIFAIAKDILEQLPPDTARRLLDTLRQTAGKVNGTGVNNAHDLTGRVFQRLISDRKYLATFYTLPASAALLARLAVAKLKRPHPDPLPEEEGTDNLLPPAGEGRDGGEFDWSDANAIAKLRIGDFACGTGALLSAVYEQIAARHEQAGGNAAAIHPVMMEEVLYGCDVMPSAIHITGSTLSGIQPDIGFGNSRLYTMPYGRQDDGSVKIGSLELLQSSSALTLFNTSDPALRTGSAGEETAAQVNVDVPDAGFDLVIMNPPFTRATNHEGSHADVVNPAFAAFNASKPDMDDMGKRLNQIGKNTCYHGNAGIASAFAALAHRKLKPGGALALVLPLSAAAGLSWQGFRDMLKRDYTDLEVLSISSDGKEMSFSSDTAIAECLVVARKRKAGIPPGKRAQFASLRQRPTGFAPAKAIAGNITDAGYVRELENGPYGGTRMTIGDEWAGELLTSPVGESWGCVRLSDYSIAQTAYALTQSQLWLPGHPTPSQLKTAPLGRVGKLGLVDRDITGPPPRGPFNIIGPTTTATYPALWNHNAKKETQMVCAPDFQLEVRQGMEAKAATVWATASRAHINRDFTFGSQALAVAFTERESVGGRVWPNVIFSDSRFDYAFAVWGNSTLGLLSYWWHSSRQQSSKASMTIRQAETLPVLDFRALSEGQLAAAEGIFDEFRELELLPAYLADADPHRALLDRRVVCDLLGLGQDVYRGVRRLAAKWCAEPSVHGGKARPRGAEYVE